MSKQSEVLAEIVRLGVFLATGRRLEHPEELYPTLKVNFGSPVAREVFNVHYIHLDEADDSDQVYSAKTKPAMRANLVKHTFEIHSVNDNLLVTIRRWSHKDGIGSDYKLLETRALDSGQDHLWVAQKMANILGSARSTIELKPGDRTFTVGGFSKQNGKFRLRGSVRPVEEYTKQLVDDGDEHVHLVDLGQPMTKPEMKKFFLGVNLTEHQRPEIQEILRS